MFGFFDFFRNRVWSFFLCAILMTNVLSCGVDDESTDYRSELLGVSGSGEHEICAYDVNVRDPNAIDQVLFVSRFGDRLLPQGKTRLYLGYTFQLVEFKSNKTKGWVADDYICKVGTGTMGPARIEVNLTTNRLSFYRGSSLIRSWNVGTARPGKITPEGQFKVLSKEKCPPYFGANGDKNVPGCTAANPLGTRALWWQDTMYGLHGTNQPQLIAEGTTAAARRLSAGCVRNLNANIEWLFDQVKVGDQIVIRR
jgi:hypothetical protein